MFVQTYVFMDLETTGLPEYEHNMTRITELSMVAIKRKHLLDTRPGAIPRVRQKLTLCFNPGRIIDQDCTDVTGLDNFLLEYEPAFNKKAFGMIDSFLNLLTPPLCLIAQNGLNFDYPILKNYLVRLKVNFTAEVLCADCYHGFYHILEKMKSDREISLKREGKKKHEILLTEEIVVSNETNKDITNYETSISMKAADETKPISMQEAIKTKPISMQVANLTKPISMQAANETEPISMQAANETKPISMQAANETTPKSQSVMRTSIKPHKPRRRLFPWGDSPRPTDSYKLKDIYSRVLNKPAIEAHHAENDCIFALEIAAALSEQFVEWVDKNHSKFDDIQSM